MQIYVQSDVKGRLLNINAMQAIFVKSDLN